MNLVLSCIAALQAPIIMMSQYRQEEKDRKRSENDYIINLEAEMQIRSLNQRRLMYCWKSRSKRFSRRRRNSSCYFRR